VIWITLAVGHQGVTDVVDQCEVRRSVSAQGDTAPDAVAQFLRLSTALTGYDEYSLLGTGMVETYYGELVRIVGAREVGSLFGALERVDPNDEQAFRAAILDNGRYGPVARNVLRMWYLGTWAQLPRDWRNAYGATSYDTDHVVSAAAYRAGLVWPTAGTHPMGARQQGFGSWAQAPRAKVNG
jgi:Membrane bound FAD containing D-sorbitol dehydrogenase